MSPWHVLLSHHAFPSTLEADLNASNPEVVVHGNATIASVKEAIEDWAKQDTQDLVLFRAGEGRQGSFQLNRNESLSGAASSGMLDSHQQSRDGSADVFLLYDACLSGSLLPLLPAPEGKSRILLASTTDGQNACFLLGGIVSFSQLIWRRSRRG